MECFSNLTIYFVIANIQILGEHHKLRENQLKFLAKGKIILLTTLILWMIIMLTSNLVLNLCKTEKLTPNKD
jgi:hypothetical protein